MVDAERVLTQYLKQNTGLRVVSKTPSGDDAKKSPWVRLTLLDDPDVTPTVPGRMRDCFFQLDCYAGTDGDQKTAHDAYAELRESLTVIHELPLVDGAVVNYPAIVRASRQPDEKFEPAMERYAVSVTIEMR